VRLLERVGSSVKWRRCRGVKVAEAKTIRVRLVRSMIGRPEKQRVVLRGMGLTKMQKTVQLPDTPQIRGMLNKVQHLVRVEE
jgi:large subunit ribosomal protein L30